MEEDDPKTTKKSDGSFWKLGFATFTAIVLAQVLESWISGPFAAFITVFLVGLVFYWIPPRPTPTYGRWLVRLLKWATLALIAVTGYKLLVKALRSITQLG